jgi:putative ABC transport system permease protein
MRHIRALLIRLGRLFHPGSDDEFDEELESHLQMQVDDNLRAGMPLDEARRAALVRLGGVESVKEAYRDRRGLPFLETTLQDVRYGFRILRRSRGSTILGILVVALGIGANTAVFSVVHAVLLSPLPYPNPDRLVTLTYGSTAGAGTGERTKQVSVPDFLDWQRDSAVFDSMAYYTTGRASVIAVTEAGYAAVATVSEDFCRVFGARPLLGRAFSRDESQEGSTGAAVIGDRYARQQFGEPARALGRTLRLGNRSVPIVGVMPPAFDFPDDTDIWFTAVGSRAQLHRRGNNFRAVARLKTDVSLEQAQAEMTGISTRLAAQFPDTNKNVRVLVTPLQDEIVGAVESMLYLLLGAVAVVLLIACATMATLLLAKATARTPEIAIRSALGASATRIVRQLLVEALIQALGAASIGVLLAVWGTRMLIALSPPDVPRLGEVAINGSVLLFTLALSVAVSILFGLPSALQATRVDVSDPLRQGGFRAAGIGGSATRQSLVVAEIALAVILVTGGVLLTKSLVALERQPLGFDPDNVLLMQATPPTRVPDWSDNRGFFQGLLGDLRHVPGVVAAGAMMGPPGRVGSESGYWIDRVPKESPLTSAHPAVMNVIAPGTFAALRMALHEGRDFDEGDRKDTAQVVIVNQALARAAFAAQNVLGRQIIAGYDSTAPMTIVGVVGDVRQYGPDREPQPEVYMPYQQHFYNGATLFLVARTSMDPVVLSSVIERKAHERSPEVSVRVTTMQALLSTHVAAPTFRAGLLSLFAVIALCLAMAGVYGVMAYVAGQRSKEIGVRIALGASAQSVVSMMLRQALKLTAIGLALGVLGAIASTRLLNGMLFQVASRDVVTYAAVAGALAVLSVLAAYIPARRATRIDPLLVLRQE